MSLSIGFPRAYEEHNVFGQHVKEMAKARIQPCLTLARHPSFHAPKIRRIPNTTIFGQIFEGSPAQTEGFSGQASVVEAPLLQERLILKIKYAFQDGPGGNPDGSKSAFFQMNFRPASVEEDFVSRAIGSALGITPQYEFTSIGALLTQPTSLVAVPPAFVHKENFQLMIPQAILIANDFVAIKDFFRDINHPEDSGDSVYIVDLDWEVIETDLGDEDMYMFEGLVEDVVVGIGATVDTIVPIDVPSPDVFSAKGILKHIEVTASTPPGTSTNFTVEVYTKFDYSAASRIFRQTGISSVADPYGLKELAADIIFKNTDSPVSKRLYVRIIEVSGIATTFDIILKGPELK